MKHTLRVPFDDARPQAVCPILTINRMLRDNIKSTKGFKIWKSANVATYIFSLLLLVYLQCRTNFNSYHWPWDAVSPRPWRNLEPWKGDKPDSVLVEKQPLRDEPWNSDKAHAAKNRLLTDGSKSQGEDKTEEADTDSQGNLEQRSRSRKKSLIYLHVNY